VHSEKLTIAHHRRIAEALGSSLHMQHQWQNALKHVRHLRASTSAYDVLGPSSLTLWLECWRLQRVADQVEAAWRCRTRQDVLAVESTVAAAATIGMRPLEVRRWRRGQQMLRHGIQASSDDVTPLRAGLPTLATWLQSFELGKFLGSFEALGVDDVRDVLELDTYTLESLGLEARDLRHWTRAVAALSPPEDDAAAPRSGGAKPPRGTSASAVLPAGTLHVENFTLRGWLERFHVSRLEQPLAALGAAAPVDLLDLSSQEVAALGMRKLEKQRWDQCVLGVRRGATASAAFNALLPYAPEEDLEPLELIDPDSLYHLLHRREPTPEPTPRELTPREPTPEPEEAAAPHEAARPPLRRRANGEHSFVDQVLERANGFRDGLALGQWSHAPLRNLFEDMVQVADAQPDARGRRNLHHLMVALLEGLSAERSRYGAFVATAFKDPILLHSAATEAGYLRIAATLVAMADGDALKLHPSFAAPMASVDGSPRTFGGEPSLAHNSPQRPHAEPLPQRPPAPRTKPVEFDAHVLEKLRYRWLASSFSPQGQRARHAWVATHQPPDRLAADDEALTLGALRALCRSVLQLTPMEVSEGELDWFFCALNHDGSGRASFYKLLGLLEAESPIRPLRSSGAGRRKGGKKKRPKSAKVSFVQVPWRNPGPSDLDALRVQAGFPY
jgi:hypothetical protein